MERISLIVMMISAVVFIVMSVIFTDKETWTMFAPIGVKINGRIYRIIIRLSWLICLLSSSLWFAHIGALFLSPTLILLLWMALNFLTWLVYGIIDKFKDIFKDTFLPLSSFPQRCWELLKKDTSLFFKTLWEVIKKIFKWLIGK